jgi:hypothetical protein
LGKNSSSQRVRGQKQQVGHVVREVPGKPAPRAESGSRPACLPNRTALVSGQRRSVEDRPSPRADGARGAETAVRPGARAENQQFALAPELRRSGSAGRPAERPSPRDDGARGAETAVRPGARAKNQQFAQAPELRRSGSAGRPAERPSPGLRGMHTT